MKLMASSFALVLLMLRGGIPAWAQGVALAEIGGVVNDPSGAAVPNAQIKATQTNTGLERVTVSADAGDFVLPDLPIGPYTLAISAGGFKSYLQSGIELHVGNKLRINVALQVGSVSQQVQVTANAAMVEVQKPSFSELVGQERLVDLPLNGREANQLVLLAGATAAVTTGGPAFDLNGARAYALLTPYATAGGQANATNWLLDGASNNDASVNVSEPYPFPDALQEFEVQTSSQEARYGVHPGGTVNAVTKSGGNQLHGDLFEFLRNGDFNARNFFAATQDSLRRNQFGGTIGGRIIKDKLFYFVGYQGTRNVTNPPVTLSIVPTTAILDNGDFSGFESGACQSSGVARTIIDPSTGAPFPNDMVPTSRFNSQALALLKYVPVASNPCGTIVHGVPANNSEDQGVPRIDWIQSEKHSVFGRFFVADYRQPVSWNGHDILPVGRGFWERDQSLTLGDTYALSPTIVNSLHFAATKLRIIRGSPADYIDPGTLGIPISYLPGFINVSVAGDFGSGGGGGYYNTPTNTFQILENLDILRGRHHFAVGGEFIRGQFNERNSYARNGSFSFNGTFTGDPLVDFMLGDIGTFTQSNYEDADWRQSAWGVYGQDEFRVTSRLRITAGVRWEPYFPVWDARGRGNYFSPAAFAAGQVTNRYQYAPPGLLFNSDPGIPHSYSYSELRNLGPRVGLAWDPTGKGLQSIRASYGLIYDMPPLYYLGNLVDNSPWGASVSITDPPGGLGNPYLGYPGGNPFPIAEPPSRTSPFPFDSVYQNVPLHLHIPYMQQWNVAYQRQIGPDWLVTVTYLGNETTHLWIGNEENPAVFIPGTCSGQPCSTVANIQQRRVLSLENPVAGAYYSSIPIVDDGGNAQYNALLVSVRHRFSHNFTILSNYTYGHCIDYGDAVGDMYGGQVQNPNNIAADRGNCESDFRHIFNTSLVAMSPAFQQPWEQRLLGNWQLSPIISANSGQWWTAYTGVDNSLTGVGVGTPPGQTIDRPNVVGNPYLSKQGPRQWTNVAAFQLNALGTYGDSARNSLLGPGRLGFDVALSRLFPLGGETRKLEARVEAFNAINCVNFAPPTNTMTSAKFGQITSASDPRILQLAMKLYF